MIAVEINAQSRVIIFGYDSPAMDDDSLDTILALIKQLEATLLGLQQLQGFVGNGVGREMLVVLIEEFEIGLAQVRRRLIQ